MVIAVIGTGNVGSALAKNWANAGHTIILGVRNTMEFKGKDLLNVTGISAVLISEAAKNAEVILVAATPDSTLEIIKSMGDVSGKVIIDAMNSIRSKPEGFANTFEAFSKLVNGAEIVKCFNSTGFENMSNPKKYSSGIDMFVAGNSKRGKEIAVQLSKDAGFENCYDFGGNDKASLLEQFALCWINLAIMQGHGREIAFKVVGK